VNLGHHDRYLTEADVERQLTLESYGYRFLRLNRFNVGRDPVRTLSARLSAFVEEAAEDASSETLDDLQAQAAGLVSKEMKACPRCEAIKPLDDFRDASLASGVGRTCVTCKSDMKAQRAALQKAERASRRGWGRRRRRR
jgi:hypothetical protein